MIRFGLLLVLGLVGVVLPAVTITVCASGCTYTTVQAGVNAANRGDIVEITAGEIFEEAVIPPYKAGTTTITVRSSLWASLPPASTRITAAQASTLMPKIQPPNTSSPVLSFGYDEQAVLSSSSITNFITFAAPHGFVDGDPISCWYAHDGTIPVTENIVYYVRDSTPTTLKVAATLGGAVIPLTTAFTSSAWRWTLAQSISNWTFQGIEFRTKPGQISLYNLVRVGTGQASSRAGLVNAIAFEHSYIHGIDGEDGPGVCVYGEANAISITDSRIEFCKLQGGESKAISFPQVAGPATVTNNYIDGASINLLTGGDYMRIYGMVPGDNGGMSITGNYFYKPFSYKWTQGTGGAADPVGACVDGAYYLNTTSGAWFLCTGTTWGAGPTCANGEYYKRTDVTQTCPGGACWSCASGVFTASAIYRQFSYGVKNLFELKSAINVTVSGNVFENNWIDGQTGIGVWVISQGVGYNTNAYARGENILFTKNILRNSSQGLRLATQGDPLNLTNNNHITVSNNLLYYIGTTQYPSIDYSSSRPLSFAGPCDDCTIDHLTVSGPVTNGAGVYFDTAPFTRPRFSNTILYANLYGLFADGAVPVSNYWGTGNILNSVGVDNLNQFAAPSSFGVYATNGRYITPATVLFTSPTNFALLPTSPYSASCTVGCAFVSTDGTDLGANIAEVNAATATAVTGQPLTTVSTIGVAGRINLSGRITVY